MLKLKQQRWLKWGVMFLSSLFYLVSGMSIGSLVFIYRFFGKAHAEQIFFHLVNPISVVNGFLIWRILLWIILPALIFLCVVYCPFWGLFVKKQKRKRLKKYQTSLWHLPISAGLCFCVVYVCGQQIGLWRWMNQSDRPSLFYEKHFVSVNKGDVHFTTKKNVILIYMESMEKGYQDSTLFEENLMPELTRLENENASFQTHRQFMGMDFTVAGVHSGLCGVPFIYPFFKNTDETNRMYFSLSSRCLPQVFKENGYTTHFVMGSSLSIGHIGNMLEKMGFDSIVSGETLTQQNILTKETQGAIKTLMDRHLFGLAQKDIEKLAKGNQPFFYVLSTMDTHFPDYFFDKEVCQRKYNDVRDVVMCSDKNIAKFVSWLKEQPFAKETVIVLMGDHLALANKTLSSSKKVQERSVMNIFLSTDNNDKFSKDRKFCTLDFAPTILAYAGAKLKQNAFGLGRNLFSDEKTLYELFGENFHSELSSFRYYYNRAMLSENDKVLPPKRYKRAKVKTWKEINEEYKKQKKKEKQK